MVSTTIYRDKGYKYMKTLQQTIDENKEFLLKSQKERTDRKISCRERILKEKMDRRIWKYKAGHGKNSK